MTGWDGLDDFAEPHEAVDVSEAMREASEPVPERITRPGTDHQVDRIAKRESVPVDD